MRKWEEKVYMHCSQNVPSNKYGQLSPSNWKYHSINKGSVPYTESTQDLEEISKLFFRDHIGISWKLYEKSVEAEVSTESRTHYTNKWTTGPKLK